MIWSAGPIGTIGNPVPLYVVFFQNYCWFSDDFIGTPFRSCSTNQKVTRVLYLKVASSFRHRLRQPERVLLLLWKERIWHADSLMDSLISFPLQITLHGGRHQGVVLIGQSLPEHRIVVCELHGSVSSILVYWNVPNVIQSRNGFVEVILGQSKCSWIPTL